MKKQQRIIIALRSKYPGDRTVEGINFKQAAEALKVSRTALINWIRDPKVEIKSSNWIALAKCTGYAKAWLEEGIEPEKLTTYTKNITGKFSIAEQSAPAHNQLKKYKWHNLCALDDSNQPTEFELMPIPKILSKDAFAVEIQSNQFSTYVKKGEIIIIEPSCTTHNRKVLVNINQEYFIVQHNKLQNTFSDLKGEVISTTEKPKIIGPITQIYGALREG